MVHFVQHVEMHVEIKTVVTTLSDVMYHSTTDFTSNVPFSKKIPKAKLKST